MRKRKSLQHTERTEGHLLEVKATSTWRNTTVLFTLSNFYSMLGITFLPLVRGRPVFASLLPNHKGRNTSNALSANRIHTMAAFSCTAIAATASPALPLCQSRFVLKKKKNVTPGIVLPSSTYYSSLHNPPPPPPPPPPAISHCAPIYSQIWHNLHDPDKCDAGGRTRGKGLGRWEKTHQRSFLATCTHGMFQMAPQWQRTIIYKNDP